jgi:TnpA family transposase
MTAIDRTTYPHFTRPPTALELYDLYTPTTEDLAFARRVTRTPLHRFHLLVLLKVVQRLGYVPAHGDIPPEILAHIHPLADVPLAVLEVLPDDRTRRNHAKAIRRYLGIRRADHHVRQQIVKALHTAATHMDNPADLINAAIEEVIRHRYELPAYSTFDDLAQQIRTQVNTTLFQQVLDHLTPAQQRNLDAMLQVAPLLGRSGFARLKDPPPRASFRHLDGWLARIQWLDSLGDVGSLLDHILPRKIQHLAAEAKALDLADLQPDRMDDAKRYTLLLCLCVQTQRRTRDQVVDMFLKRITRMHQSGRDKLAKLRDDHRTTTAELIDVLASVVQTTDDATNDQHLGAAIRGVLTEHGGIPSLRTACAAIAAYHSNNYYPLMTTYFSRYRPLFFRLLRALDLHATTTDSGVMPALEFLLANEQRRATYLPADVDLDFASELWQRTVTVRTKTITRYLRQPLEVCLFSTLADALKAGDIAVAGAEKYADYRAQLLPWDTCAPQVATYCATIDLPPTAAQMVADLKAQLQTRARAVDLAYPDNAYLSITADGVASLKRIVAQPVLDGLAQFEAALENEIADRNLLDILGNVAQWTQFTRHFGPPSGGDSKLPDAVERAVMTVFGYGCNLGPAQTARHTRGRWTADMIATMNRQHTTVRKLEAANRDVINAFHRLVLPTFWGNPNVAVADGTHVEMPYNRLLAEQHIRYGAYGGIIYQHISDRYIALFSRFIACGMWEAVYILDGLISNTTDIQPDIVHADTQGQATPVFGLAYLLGIQLLPRIRHWKDLVFVRPTKEETYTHLDPLFRGVADWDLIERHWDDMLQVVISIKAGTLLPSAILQRLGTYSRKNKLYQAFSALGYVLRTLFLLEYISSLSLRQEITAKTNKLESFHAFSDWLTFGGDGVLSDRDPDDQEKRLKYRELVANAVMYQNTVDLTAALSRMGAKGILITPALLGTLSPYLTRHIKRFGDYVVDLSRPVAPVDVGAYLIHRFSSG